MPSIPKYNQNKTNDLNYAKRRVVDAEKKGIANLISPGIKDITRGDAQKIAEQIILYLEEIRILMEKSFGFFDDIEYADGVKYELKNIDFAPKVFALLIIINKFTLKTLSLSRKLRYVIKFVNLSTIEELKNKLVELSDSVDAYLIDLMREFISDLKQRAVLGEKEFIDEVESIVSDIDSSVSESENASQLDLWDPNAWFADTELDFLDGLAGAIRDAIGPGDDESSVGSDFETAISQGRDVVREGLDRFRQPRRKQYVGKRTSEKYEKLAEKFQMDISEVYNILMDAIDSYNEARVKPEEALSERKEMMNREYIGSGRTYSVGNRYAEQLYNSQGLYK